MRRAPPAHRHRSTCSPRADDADAHQTGASQAQVPGRAASQRSLPMTSRRVRPGGSTGSATSTTWPTVTSRSRSGGGMRRIRRERSAGKGCSCDKFPQSHKKPP